MDQLYDTYMDSLYGVVLRIVETTDLAEDVMQETFIKIWQKIDSFDSKKGSLFTWLLNIARNTAIDKRRSRYAKDRLQKSPVDKQLKPPSYSMNINHIGIREKMECLIPEQQIIIDLMYFHGRTQKEIAEKLQIPIGTVKTRTRAALKQLRKVIFE